jgi:hypothetical protein
MVVQVIGLERAEVASDLLSDMRSSGTNSSDTKPRGVCRESPTPKVRECTVPRGDG